MTNNHRSKFSNLSNWKEEAWKNQGFNGIRTRDLRDTDAMLYQLSYEARWAAIPLQEQVLAFVWFISDQAWKFSDPDQPPFLLKHEGAEGGLAA